MKTTFLELYIKEKNLLQLPLFCFQKSKKRSFKTKWTKKGTEYSVECLAPVDTKITVPGAFEQDVYAVSCLIWVRNGMPDEGIKTSYSEIANVMKLNPRDNNHRIKKAIESLTLCNYRLAGCFRHKMKSGMVKDEEDYDFSLFTEATHVFRKKGKLLKGNNVALVFPQKIRDNLKAEYYQRLEMKKYKKLPSGLPRRLYEFLAKRRWELKVPGAFHIKEVDIWVKSNIWMKFAIGFNNQWNEKPRFGSLAPVNYSRQAGGHYTLLEFSSRR
ncbi:replication initiator protein A [Candidatus Babeliales bacterium]|nr:replication initiator protein A [Candidatus Babeliales bacterium]